MIIHEASYSISHSMTLAPQLQAHRGAITAANPCTVSFVGCPQSGKSTLLEKLASSWKQEGYTFACLQKELINVDSGLLQEDLRNCKSWLRDFDFVLVEALISAGLPKVVLLDEGQNILDGLNGSGVNGAADILAVVGPWQTRPPPKLQVQKAGLELESVPYFNWDNIAGIRAEIENRLRSMASPKGLFGLVLAGGKSKRMGQDKALMRYRAERSQLQTCYELLQAFCTEVLVSARAEQVSEFASVHSYDFVPDTFLELGPLGGLLSAWRVHPGAAFLAVAIDLPALNEETLSHLVAQRDPFFCATAFSSRHGHFLEPLCTIYEAKAYHGMMSLLAEGLQCPAKMLQHLRVKSLKQNFQGEPLVNVNTPLEFQEFQLRKDAHYEK